MIYLRKSLSYISKGIFLLLVFSLALPTAWPNQQITINVNGIPVSSDVPPFIDNNSRTMVPVRFVTEALGSQILWDETNQRVQVTRGNTLVELWINQRLAKVNGNDRTMDTEAVLIDGRTMVPLRFLAETLGFNVSWDAKTFTVGINSSGNQGQAIVTASKSATVMSNVVNVRTGPDITFPRLTHPPSPSYRLPIWMLPHQHPPPPEFPC